MEELPPTSKRLDYMQKRRNEKLKSDLIAKYGEEFTSLIDIVIRQKGLPLFQQGRSYFDVFDVLSKEIIETLERQKVPEPTPQPPPMPVRQEPVHIEPARPEKRYLPVKPKEQIFDEWAAVMRLQAEVGKLAENAEKEEQREKQRLYRQELDRQKEQLFRAKAEPSPHYEASLQFGGGGRNEEEELRATMLF